MNIPSEIRVLRERSAIGWLRERDIDLLLCSELHAAGPVRDHFAGVWPNRPVKFAGAWVSHSEIDGESDLVIEFQGDNRHFVLLVENKIAAEFQPDQAARYVERAARWRRHPSIEVVTVLLCPSEYISRPSTELFDKTIAFEDLIGTLRDASDNRSAFLAQTLMDGIESYRRGYVAIPDQAVTSVWAAIWKIASQEYQLLNMEKPSTKPGRSTWIYLRRPSGFNEDDTKRCVVAYKADRGQVDLQFSGMSQHELEQLFGDLVETDMSVVKASKSASVRVSVPPIVFSTSPEPQGNAIREGLRQAERLRRLFVEKRIGERLRSSHSM